jgi:cullin 1
VLNIFFFRIPEGLGELKRLLENHINNQGLAAIEKLGDEALNVSEMIKQ